MKIDINSSASFDYEGAEISYLWSAPEGVVLSDETIVNPVFTAPAITESTIDLVFSLVVNDGVLDSTPDEVVITVINSNLIPVANAGLDNDVMEENIYILDGSDSSDPEDSQITYLWTAPEGVTLSDYTSVDPSFTAPDVTENTVLVFSLIVNDGEFNSELDEVLITVLPVLPIVGLEFDEENCLLKWIAPGAIDASFRYDDGVVFGQLGANNESSMLGVAYYENSIVEEVSWFLTSESNSHNVVTVVLLGLDDQGAPDINQQLYINENVPNSDDEWSVLILEEPVEAANGFYVGLFYPGYLSIGIDDGIVEPYTFIPGSHWISMDWVNSGWENPEDYGFIANFLIRATGFSFGVLESRDIARTQISKPELSNFLQYSALEEPIITASLEKDRFFTDSYNIYIDGDFAAMFSNSYPYGTEGFLTTPSFDLSSATDPIISFY